MDDNIYPTDYAPAERVCADQINQEVQDLIALPQFSELLDSIPEIIFMLNKQRQIVFANQTFVDVFNITDRLGVYGLRPGEAIQCVHSDEHTGGCGTTAFCKTCGAVKAALSGLSGEKKSYE